MARTVTCISCQADPGKSPQPGEVETAGAGAAGDSARREYKRLSKARDFRVRGQHPKIGGFLLAVTDEPQSTKAWDKGAVGETRVGKTLDRFAAEDRIRVLHDRRIPASRANIDHIVITRFGIVVIDTKNYTGRVEQRTSGSLFRPGSMKLYVHGRDRSTLVDGVRRQVDVVSGVAGSITDTLDVAITGMLCFANADFALFAKPFTIQGVGVHWPRSMAKAVAGEGHLTLDAMNEITVVLAVALRPA